MTLNQRLCQLKIDLPQPKDPLGSYQSTTSAHGLLFVSGQFPFAPDGTLAFRGAVGSSHTVAQGYDAAELAAMNALAQIRQATDDFATFDRLVRVEGHVASASGFFDQARVIDGASDLFNRVLSERGRHARTAFAHRALPANATVELAVIAALST